MSTARKPAPVREQPERKTRPALDAVVARVREDARTAPEDYLKQTEVPGGGE